MFQDTGNLPIAGSALFAILLYVVVAFFITGQVVGERTIAKSNWAGICQSQIRADLEVENPAPQQMPKLGCDALFGSWFGRDGAAYCNMHGHLFENNPINRALNTVSESKRKLQRKRMAHAASKTGSRCDCAVTTTLEKRRVPLAIYAGTLRLVTPPSIKTLTSELKSSLNSAQCAMKG
ncbi:MAG: hypothetical protein ACSHYC_05790 [Alphaproteobacteria bacterium]